MAALGTIGAVISGISTVVSAAGTIAAGKAQKQEADHAAALRRVEVQQENAIAQRRAQGEARKGRLAQSRLRALSAKSGFDPNSAGIDAISDRIGVQTTYNEAAQRFGGRDRLRAGYAEAAGMEATGRARAAGARASAFGTLLGGASNMFTQYGGGGFSANRQVQSGGKFY